MSSLDEMYKTLTNAMKSEINTIKKEKDQWETQKKLLIKKQFQPGEIITLNVGGKIFATAIETLQQQINGKDTVLSAMFSGRFELTKDKHGNIFIDRDGTTFRYILNYLRVGGDVKKFIPPKNEQHLQELILEAEYFGLEDLKKYLKPDSFANSKILCEEYISKLHEWIGARKNWQLCYQGTRDGFSASDFHAKCNNKGETVTVIKSTGGWIFGGYTPIDWTSRGGYAFDSRTFLFTLKNNTGTQMKLKNNGPHQCKYKLIIIIDPIQHICILFMIVLAMAPPLAVDMIYVRPFK